MVAVTLELTGIFVAFVGAVVLLSGRVEKPHPESNWLGVVALALCYSVVALAVVRVVRILLLSAK
ncbi:hypothetical protein [Haloferax sp. DFSO60]|uniref:hypothetical protein n=1 Tax=Haloferax sp. DFSO60 TaxID=3388652 RepID=UPI00397D2B79